MSWSLPFSEPIVLPDGSELATLRDAYDHLNNFPKSEQDAEEWKAAAHCLIEAAEHRGAVAFARIGMLRAMRQQANRAPTLELVDLTMREVQQLKTDRDDPILRDQASAFLARSYASYSRHCFFPCGSRRIKQPNFNGTRAREPVVSYQTYRRPKADCV